MKLLFDQNISFRLSKKIQDIFPGSEQIRVLGLENKSDKEIWEFAKAQNFTIVTFDIDFYDFSLIWGSPPKIVWMRLSDQRTEKIESLLRNRQEIIKDFFESDNLDCLELI